MKSPAITSKSFDEPLYLAPSAWVEHIPFAFWLIENLKPKQIVELGVHYGVSYFAFCQAVKNNNLPTICYAVDNWIGDSHTGFYDNSVFETVNMHNKENYSGFSYLLKTDFDQALAYFEDGSIDLLHIDGLHTYEAVKNDFDNWLPKLSKSSLVLIHDIVVREKDFGVYKFWEELSTKFPSFSFIHDFGLGVLATGFNISPALSFLFDKNISDRARNEIRLIYHRLGASFSRKLRIKDIEYRIGELSREVNSTNQQISEFHENLSRKEEEKEKILKEFRNLQTESIIEKEAQNNLNNKLINYQEKEKQLSDRIQLLEQSLGEKETRIKDYVFNIELLKNDLVKVIHESTAKSEKHEADYKSLEQKREMLSNKLDDLNAGYYVIEKEKAFNETTLRDMKKDKLLLENELAANQSLLEKRATDYETLEDKNEFLNKKVNDLEVALNILTNEKDFHQSESQKSRHENQLLQDELKKKEEDLASFMSELAQEKGQRNKIEEALIELRDSFSWKITKPLRGSKEYILRVIHSIQKSRTADKNQQFAHVPPEILPDYRLLLTNDLFDQAWYLNEYKDVSEAAADPILHYLIHGYKESRNPSCKFNTRDYFQRYPDVRIANVNPLVHYLRHGKDEGRIYEVSIQEPTSKIHTPVVPQIRKYDIDHDLLENFKYKPKISFAIPTYNTKPELLQLAIESVKNQAYANWELCIADDCSTKVEIRELLVKYGKEKKIKVTFLGKNAGISEATNEAIKNSTGDFIALMDHDDEIPPDALFWVVNELNQYPDTEIIYSDECKIDEAGILSDYFYKPDWSPELLMNMMYTGHLTVYKKDFLVKKVGLFRKEYDFSQDYDLMLRAVEKTDKIRHISKFLYYWRITEGSAAQGDKPYARVTNLAALADAGKRRGLEGEIFEFPVANRLKIKVQREKKVSLVIPTDSYTNLKETIESIQASTTYLNYEIVPVTNSKLLMQMKEIFSYDNISYCTYDKPFNFSDKCNAGALHAAGEIIVFFNDDVRPLQNDWIENTIEFFEVPEIGGISPKLLYENDTIQYAGMITGVRNLTGTSFHCLHKDATLYLNYPQLVRDVSILSGACLAIRKELFFRLGGFDIVNTPVGHSDVDLSFRILEAGHRCVYTPYATLRHVGHLSLREHEKEEKKQFKKDKADIFLLKHWIKYLDEDKYFPVGMRDLLYSDSPEPFQLYKPTKEQVKGEKGDVILVSHDLSLSGAPIMLFDTAKVLAEQGYFVIVFCPTDGPLRKMYQDAGIPVIIDELVLRQHHTFERFAKNFDYIICNTVVTWPIVKQMQHIVKTIWWIQEGKAIEYFKNDDEFVNTIREAQHLVGVSDYSISFVKPYNSKITKIYNACYDLDRHNGSTLVNNKEKIIFGLVGSIERRKGHDILVEALEAINPSLLKKAEVWIIGRTLKEHYLKNILPRMNNIGVIKMLGERSHDECLELMRQSDVILNISRDDPFPLVVVEALCMGKTCVVSTNSGLAELIKNGESGYVFKSENAKDLSDRLVTILKDRSVLKKIGKNARYIFEKHLTIGQFKNKLKDFMEEVEGDTSKVRI